MRVKDAIDTIITNYRTGDPCRASRLDAARDPIMSRIDSTMPNPTRTALSGPLASSSDEASDTQDPYVIGDIRCKEVVILSGDQRDEVVSFKRLAGYRCAANLLSKRGPVFKSCSA